MFYLSRQDLETTALNSGVCLDNIARINGNFWLELEPDDTAFTPGVKEIFTWEAWVTVAIARELHEQRGSDLRFLDIGANVGYYSMLAAASGVYTLSVEPNPDLAAMIKRSAEFNGFQNVNVSNIAFADRTDTMVLHVPDGHSGAGSLAGNNGREVKVKVDTLDRQLMAKDRLKLVIKVDVEGFEREVWDGAKRVRGEHDNVWFLEWVPERHGEQYNREWLEEVEETHSIQVVGYDGNLKAITIDEALNLKFETIVFRSK